MAKETKLPKATLLKHIGSEPIWDGVEKWDEKRILTIKSLGLNHYNYFYEAKDLRPKIFEWMKFAEYSDEDMRCVKAMPDVKLSITMGSISSMLLKGLPDEYSDWLRARLDELIVAGKTVSKPAKKAELDNKAPRPSIQDHMREQLGEIIGQFEEWVDTIDNKDFKQPKVFDWMKKENVAQVHVKKIRDYYTPLLTEIETASTKDAPDDLKEAYRSFKRADFKRHKTFFAELFNDLASYESAKKATRKTSKAKAPSKSKLVAKLNYQPDDTKYKVASINPTEIIGVQQLWVFNTKTRKVGVYNANENDGGLGVKGSTITGYNEKTSVTKTIRKPEKYLPDLMKGGKIKLRTILSNVKATEIKLTGRINKDTVLLRVIK
jgi:hypothetical protein